MEARTEPESAEARTARTLSDIAQQEGFEETSDPALQESADRGQAKLLNYGQLYELWERQQWATQDLDFSQDRIDWHERISEEERFQRMYGLSGFFIGEQRVTDELGPIMRACRHIQVDRADGERSLAVAQEFLDRGEVVGIFPEATISRAMEIKDLKTGAARIAAAADVPLLPLVLWGTQRLMTKDHDRDLSRGTAITVSVGAPVPLSGDAVADTAALRTAMSGLLDDAIRSYPQHEPGAWWLPASYGGSAPTLQEAARIDADEKAARAARKAAREGA